MSWVLTGRKAMLLLQIWFCQSSSTKVIALYNCFSTCCTQPIRTFSINVFVQLEMYQTFSFILIKKIWNTCKSNWQPTALGPHVGQIRISSFSCQWEFSNILDICPLLIRRDTFNYLVNFAQTVIFEIFFLIFTKFMYGALASTACWKLHSGRSEGKMKG